MIESIEAFGYYNAFYCLMYLVAAVAFCRRDFALSVAPFVIILALPVSMFNGYSVIFAYCATAILYLAFSIACSFFGMISVSLALCAMSVYCFLFALDGWVNSDVETWMYLNHEIIIAVLHLVIILSNSKRLSSMVGRLSDSLLCSIRDSAGGKAIGNCFIWRKG